MRKKEPPYFDEKQYPGEYEDSLLEKIEWAISDWYEEKNCSIFDDDTYQCMYDFCNTLMSASADPTGSDSISKLLNKTGMQLETCEDEGIPDFEEFIESELAKESLGMIASGITNLWDLVVILALIQESPIPEIPLNYLKRVFRCYIWGLGPECVILCRSVLDVAIDEKIPDRLCAQHCDSNKLYYSLADKLKTIKKAKLLTQEMINKFYEVKLRGDKCVHGDMQIVKDLKGTVTDTAMVLIAISKLDIEN